MLDVHPPHAPTHTWKDFFIHIATIVVGLLIAVGLEQTVEEIHHQQQRVQLEDDLRAEAKLNIQIIDFDLPVQIAGETYAANLIAIVRDTQPVNGFVRFTLPALPDGVGGASPSHGVWAVAKTTGTVDLLPAGQAQIDDRLDFEASEAVRIRSLADAEDSHLGAVLRSLHMEKAGPGSTVRLSSAQRDELVLAVSESLQIEHLYLTRLMFWKGGCEAVLHNASTMEEMFTYIKTEAAKVPSI